MSISFFGKNLLDTEQLKKLIGQNYVAELKGDKLYLGATGFYSKKEAFAENNGVEFVVKSFQVKPDGATFVYADQVGVESAPKQNFAGPIVASLASYALAQVAAQAEKNAKIELEKLVGRKVVLVAKEDGDKSNLLATIKGHPIGVVGVRNGLKAGLELAITSVEKYLKKDGFSWVIVLANPGAYQGQAFNSVDNLLDAEPAPLPKVNEIPF